MDRDPDCIFCKITRGEDETTRILYQDEEYAVFSDLYPAAKHHYLICPKKHIRDAKVLKKADLPMVEELIRIAKKVLVDNGADINDIRLGFHWPPFISVPHLHLHAISPYSSNWSLSRIIGKYSNSFWFATEDFVLKRLRALKD